MVPLAGFQKTMFVKLSSRQATVCFLDHPSLNCVVSHAFTAASGVKANAVAFQAGNKIPLLPNDDSSSMQLLIRQVCSMNQFKLALFEALTSVPGYRSHIRH
jgi:hypothetical protein